MRSTTLVLTVAICSLLVFVADPSTSDTSDYSIEDAYGDDEDYSFMSSAMKGVKGAKKAWKGARDSLKNEHYFSKLLVELAKSAHPVWLPTASISHEQLSSRKYSKSPAATHLPPFSLAEAYLEWHKNLDLPPRLSVHTIFCKIL
ncbi:hypothetical protein BC828DRAFT_439462 [Blastocladiella britannica]|nr:hypothetical protein BC828DRAFT_439462 [Blastocladiella britannica]